MEKFILTFIQTRKISFLLILCLTAKLLLFAACDKVGKVCQVSDPLTELPWLKEQINAMKTDSNNKKISKAILKNIKTKKKIDAIAISFNFPYVITSYYNCSGEGLCGIGGAVGNQCKEYEVIKEEVIYVNP
jgi:hypothetical protein